MPIQQMMLGPVMGPSPTGYVDELFASNTYIGNGTANNSTQTITNGINMSGKGGMLWIKERDDASSAYANPSFIVDTNRGGNKFLRSNGTTAQTTTAGSEGNGATFQSNGYIISGANGITNQSNPNYYSSWCFRQNKKFFDVVTYSGNDSNGREIAHNIEGDVGCVMVKCTSSGYNWTIWHAGIPAGYGTLNADTAWTASGTDYFGAGSGVVAPTSSVFTVMGNGPQNKSGETYVAYVWGTNASGNGEFGPDADADIIKCGTYDGDGTSHHLIDCGFEAQWVLVKNADATADWAQDDSMKGLGFYDYAYSTIYYPNEETNEVTNGPFYADPKGFRIHSNYNTNSLANTNGQKYLYIAIAAATGKTATVPETGNDSLAVNYGVSSGAPTVLNAQGWSIDMIMQKASSGDSNFYNANRLMGEYGLYINDNSAAWGFSNSVWDWYPYGWNKHTGGTPTYLFWMWRRTQCFDMINYIGNGGGTITHNLGAEPEMVWIKQLTGTYQWFVYHKDLNGGTNPWQYNINLGSDGAETSSSTMMSNTQPTATTVTVSSSAGVGSASHKYTMYLWRSVEGISKCGGYTGNGSNTGPTISCGFQPRFLIIKCATQNSTHWVQIFVNPSDSSLDYFQISSPGNFADQSFVSVSGTGFQVTDTDSKVNTDSEEYIYYAHV